HVHSRKFCCCIPVRLGLFVISILLLVGSGIWAVAGWIAVSKHNDFAFSTNQERALIVSTALYTALAVMSFFGLVGAITKARFLVRAYSATLWIHFLLSLAAGAWFIYELFHDVDMQSTINDCVGNSTDPDEADICRKAFKIGRGVTIGLLAVSWLFELWGCLIVPDYVSQLEEE
ncbi:hypothetical protein OF83DRAFT_1030902, partial [Amylostereum chailletii]